MAAARESADLAHFAAELALDPPQSSADLAGPPHLDEDYLVLSTIHSAKGLEWEAVHLLALYDGNFPACMSAGTSESVDEERRLLYVGVTRARRRAASARARSATTTGRGGSTTPTATASRRRFLTAEVQATCEQAIRTERAGGLAVSRQRAAAEDQGLGRRPVLLMAAGRSCDAVDRRRRPQRTRRAALLARAGRSVVVLERREQVGGAAVSGTPFAGVGARLSRYAYLVSLFPARCCRELGLALELRRRRDRLVHADGDGGLLVDRTAGGRRRVRDPRRARGAGGGSTR